jgi:enoyl-[acyl-carrier-protein] reductase (NADH)
VRGREAIAAEIEQRTMLGRAATLEDVARAAAFAASDHARTITASALNITCGKVVG